MGNKGYWITIMTIGTPLWDDFVEKPLWDRSSACEEELYRHNKSQDCSWDFCASGWAWIQEDEIVRNLWKL